MSDPFPPPHYISVKSAVPGIDVYKPQPPEDDQKPIVDFKCPHCGANTAYNVADGGITCKYCGYHESPQGQTVGKQAEDFEFKIETLERASQGWGIDRKQLACQRCGARVSLPITLLTYTCPFCGSNKVLQQQAPQDDLRPKYLIPFTISAETCQNIVKPWLSSNWMTPSALNQVVKIGNFTPIYAPFWTFDAYCPASWQADVGHSETERYFENGEWKTRSIIKWRLESGRLQEHFDDVLVAGTYSLSKKLLDNLNNYNLQGLVSYEPEYLAGIQAQAYNITLDKAWETGRDVMRENTRSSCLNQATSSYVRNFRMSLDFREETWRYILLPVYLTAYSYNSQTYQIMINGQNGTISGQRPVDWAKIWLVIIALLTPGTFLGLIGLVTIPLGGVGLIIASIGFVLFVIGLIIASIIFNKAQVLDDA